MTADYNASIAPPIDLMLSIKDEKPLALATALAEGGADWDSDARWLLVRCLQGTDRDHEIVNVRRRGQRFAKYPFALTQSEDDLTDDLVAALISGLRSGRIEIRPCKKPPGQPFKFWTKLISDGAAIEQRAADLSGVSLRGDFMPNLTRGTLAKAIDEQRKLDGKTAGDPKPFDRYAERALAAWRRLVDPIRKANRD